MILVVSIEGGSEAGVKVQETWIFAGGRATLAWLMPLYYEWHLSGTPFAQPCTHRALVLRGHENAGRLKGGVLTSKTPSGAFHQ